MKLSCVLAGALWALLAAAPALAADARSDDPPFLSGGIGWYDFLQSEDEAAEFRLEYRHNERFFFDLVKPWAGLEVTGDGAVWGGAGVLLDLYLGRRLVLTGSFAPGLYYNGDGKYIGSFVEFRSQIELGWRFDDRSRLSAALSHTSNAGLTRENSGVEVLTLYYHLPFDRLFR